MFRTRWLSRFWSVARQTLRCLNKGRDAAKEYNHSTNSKLCDSEEDPGDCPNDG